MPTHDEPFIPGRPGSAPEAVSPPAEPVDPPAGTPDQAGPAPVTPTGAPVAATPADRAQQGRFLTTAHGVPLRDTDHSLKVGSRGPTLLQDHHLREKISHFDHERIPERVVHARGAGAHGEFVANGAAASLTCAPFLAAGARTATFTRFSTVLGSRGSADTARDTRGFATRFYTEQGNYDLVANNIPVFFIQDGVKFPDIIHAAKPHPDRDIPQAQSAHDSFWDFVTLNTEAQHHTLWNMSDRGVPRSYRMMEGFGVHTWLLINADGQTSLVKLHWKPRLGVHSVTWEEAQIANGVDPDFHRRDLYDAIESGALPEWDLGVQVMPDSPDALFDSIDLLDPTKLVPEELAPVQVIGTLTLNRNPVNFAEETEQVGFNVANLVAGIEVTNDPLLQARLFSYLDTQITRLGGPNWNQLPINRAHAPINDMLREGQHQTALHSGVAPYHPNTLDAGNPSPAGDAQHAFIDVPVVVAEGVKTRSAPASFDDHYSQPRMFYRSMSAVEQAHIIDAYSFELSRCWEQTIRERQLQCLAEIDQDLCAAVAARLGLPAPAPVQAPDGELSLSPALSQVGGRWPVAGRQVGIVVGPQAPLEQVQALQHEFSAAQVVALVAAPTAAGPEGLVAQRSYATMSSVEFDAVVVVGELPQAADCPSSFLPPGQDAPNTDPRVVRVLQESWRHAKPMAGLGAPVALEAAGVDSAALGVATGNDPVELARTVVKTLEQHRVWDRFAPAEPATVNDSDVR